ncbi:hypothetical protein GCM10007362_33710 [Saccharibacillus endophyticus]|uniref:Biotin carboxylase n=1 Tax=Saccharibacillus endophyticus TaxID=2060666 RepID=A0ABQ1ZYE6_9BACL|nr:hypothetical protein GCM10007362_33710 [Saccharibacillus endophyticus]
MNQTKIPKRISSALVNSLSAGVVPRIGLEYIAVGRKLEIESVLRELGNVAEGGAAFKLITGRYGSGKSFLIQILRNYAMDRDFVVADADLSPERRLVGTKGQGLGTYRELMTHLSTRTRPDGGALEAVLQKWFASLQQQAMAELGLRPDDEKLPVEVERRIFEVTGNMEHMVHGFDFARVLAAYWNGYKMSDDELKQNALRWLRGEFPTKTEARKTLGVGVIIDDDNWYDYMKLWAEFMSKIGYKGLLLFIDEGVNLYKITNTVSRQSNYEKLLTIFNDTMQGKAQHLGIFLGGTPQFVEDTRRGLFSYDALRSRLVAGRFGEGAGMLHYAGPILRLEMLSHAEILVLLEKLRGLHASHYGYESTLDQQQLTRFMESELGRMGADALLTTREVVRDFMDLLNTLHQYPDRSFDELLPDMMGRASQGGGAFDGLGRSAVDGIPVTEAPSRERSASAPGSAPGDNKSAAPAANPVKPNGGGSVLREQRPSDDSLRGGRISESAAPAPFRPRGGGFQSGENVESLRTEPDFYSGNSYEAAGYGFRGAADTRPAYGTASDAARSGTYYSDRDDRSGVRQPEDDASYLESHGIPDEAPHADDVDFSDPRYADDPSEKQTAKSKWTDANDASTRGSDSNNGEPDDILAELDL